MAKENLENKEIEQEELKNNDTLSQQEELNKTLDLINQKQEELNKTLELIDKKQEELSKTQEEITNKSNELETKMTDFSKTKEIDKKALEDDSLKTGQKLKEEKHIEIVIPKSELNPLEKNVPVTINGYTYNILRGERVSVPETVYEILKEAKYL